MTDNPTLATFYLGDQLDAQTYQPLGKPVFYCSSDLTTHGVILGMSGVGKTALGLVMVEEAILDGIPVIIIDPTGEAANLLLTFPDLQASSFAPWIPQGEARQANLSEEAYAQRVAETWRNGLAANGIPAELLKQFRAAALFSIYTPGSEAGIPVDILSIRRPPQGITQEMYLEHLQGLVSNLLALAGIRGKTSLTPEHILLSTLIDLSWGRGIDLTLEGLIAQIPQPAIENLGQLPLEEVFPERQRLQLAQQLNTLLATPVSAVWRKGEPIQIENFLYTPDNRPKVSIFYLAHLDDETRTSILSVILQQLISWMHQQGGTQQLRALQYIDDMEGYLPPHPYDPPTKDPLLYLLKEGRAFGLGILMAASNPTDLDYRALSNAGTWLMGRLPMEQDNQRLREGLAAVDNARQPLDFAALENIIRTLPQSAFLLHNIHQVDNALTVLQTRFPLCYVHGPLTLDHIHTLMAEQKATPKAKSPLPPSLPEFAPVPLQQPVTPSESTGQPVVSSGITQYFLPVMVSFPQAMAFWGQQQGVEIRSIPPTQPIIYYPLLIAQAQVRYQHPAWQGDLRRSYGFQVFEVPPSGMVKWGNWWARLIDPALVQEKPYAQATYAPLQNLILDDARLQTLRQDMLEYIHREAQLTIPALPSLELYANPNEPFPMFQARALETARQQRDAELAAIVTRYEDKLAELEESHHQIQAQVSQAAQQLPSARGGSMNIFNIARTTYSLLHRHYFHPLISLVEMGVQGGEQRNQSREFDKLMQATQAAEFQAQIDMLHRDYYAEVDALNQKWTDITGRFESLSLHVNREQISVELFGLGWLPYYSTSYQNQPLLLPAL